MAAYIYVVPEADVDAVERLLDALEEGGIVVTPGGAKALAEKGVDLEAADGQLIEYNYGGEADLFVDVVRGADHAMFGEILEQIGPDAEDRTITQSGEEWQREYLAECARTGVKP